MNTRQAYRLQIDIVSVYIIAIIYITKGEIKKDIEILMAAEIYIYNLMNDRGDINDKSERKTTHTPLSNI